MKKWRKRRNNRKPFKRYKRIAQLGLPQSKLVKMRYVSHFSINPSAGSANQHYFRCNSIFDPDYTSSGSQPISHDEWAVLYKRYTVVGSKIRVTAFSSSASLACMLAVNVKPDNNAAADTNIKNVLEQKGVVYKSVAPLGSGPALAHVTKKWSAKKYFQLANMKDGYLHGSDFGGNPTNEAYFQVNILPINLTDDLPETYLTATIDYIVLLRDPLPLTQS